MLISNISFKRTDDGGGIEKVDDGGLFSAFNDVFYLLRTKTQAIEYIDQITCIFFFP